MALSRSLTIGLKKLPDPTTRPVGAGPSGVAGACACAMTAASANARAISCFIATLLFLHSTLLPQSLLNDQKEVVEVRRHSQTPSAGPERHADRHSAG